MSQAQVARVRRYKSATQSQRLGGFGVSLFLHVSLVVLIIFSARTPVKQFNLDTPTLSLRQLTIGASGPKPAVQPEVGKEAAPAPKPAEPEAVPVPKIEELPKQPEPVAEAPKEEPKPEEPPKPSDEDTLNAALTAATKDAKPAPKVSGGQSAIDIAMAENTIAAKSEKVITGESGTGIGVVALYEEVVAMEIRKHFTTRPYADGRVMQVKVLVEIAANGGLIQGVVLEPSGDPTLDANVMRAIREVGRFEPPPGKRPQKLELLFSSDIYAGQ